MTSRWMKFAIFWHVVMHGTAVAQQFDSHMRQPRMAAAAGKKMAKKEQVPEAPGELGICESTTCSFTKDNRDWTSRVGLGESPGIPNLEYLGIGYDILKGNPRGSDYSELDPGFRNRVFKLDQKQTRLTVDQDFLVPVGTEVKYVSTCKFDSESTELSSQKQYQEQLSREASTELTLSGGIAAAKKSPKRKIAGKLQASLKFSESEKFEKFTDTTKNEQTVTFEAKAICSEFEASFSAYAEKSLEDEFFIALEDLPMPFNASNDGDLQSYAEFIDAYGTHYVKSVVLGGKHVYSTSLSVRDVMELTRERVEVKESLSFSLQFAIGTPEYVKDALSAPSTGDQITIINNCAKEDDNDDTKSTKEASGDFSLNYEKFTRTASEKTALNKITQKSFKTTEVNVGGNPPIDGNWKEWAASVRAKPMPIFYELEGLWNVMNETREDAFLSAIQTLYKVNLDDDLPPNEILDALHFGVFDPEGVPISTYSFNPSSNYRALLQLESFPGSADTSEALGSKDLIVKAGQQDPSEWLGWKGPNKPGYFACGARVSAEYDDGAEDEGITEIGLRFCDTSAQGNGGQIDKELAPKSDESEYDGGYEMCAADSYIAKFRVKYSTDEDFGIYAMEMICRQPGSTTDGPEIRLFCNDDGTDDQGKNGPCDLGGFEPWKGPPEDENNKDLADYFITAGNVQLHDQDSGIESFQVRYQKLVTTGPKTGQISYTAVWENSQVSVTPFFASVVRGDTTRNEEEDFQQLAYLDFPSLNLIAESFVPYGVGVDSEKATIGVTDFKSDIDRADIPAFSFLSVDNLPGNHSLVSGVVNPRGIALNDLFGAEGGIGFEIVKQSAHEIVVAFDLPFDKSPTILAFPNWFPGRLQQYPVNLGNVAIAVKSCTTMDCRIALGAESSAGVSEHLGFNFLALDGSLENNAIVHGKVAVANVADASSIYQLTNKADFVGFSADSFLTESNLAISMNVGVDYKVKKDLVKPILGGVKITFIPAFSAIPSVIVSPKTDSKLLHDGIDQFSLPSCVVEHITKKSAFVKCAFLDTTGDADATNVPIDFYFVAAGPPRT